MYTSCVLDLFRCVYAPQVHHSTAQERMEGKMTSLYTLEVSGPVLPYHIHELCSLVKVTQSGNFSMTSSTAVTLKLPTATLKLPTARKS